MTSPQRLRATYAFQPTDHLIRKEFYIWDEAITRWKTEGLPDDWAEQNLFQYDEPSGSGAGAGLGWCEPPLLPAYEEKIISSDGPYEVYQDYAGRWLKVFEGRRHGFMPQYVKHPVTGWKDWEEDVLPRLDPHTPGRDAHLPERLPKLLQRQQEEGWFITQDAIGGYMYLRALLGPEEVLFALHDQPDLVHAMMRQWVELMDTALRKVQSVLELDELFFGEDICYKTGPLISPRMIEEFLLPYYAHVIDDAKARQSRHIYIYVDTDGCAPPVIPLYRKVGLQVMSPFEVAAGNDILEIAQQYPDLVISGGIDKRVLAAGPQAIDDYLERVIPPLRARGGYIPTCDHGVPDDVSLESYLHYRRRMCELDCV